MMTLTVKDIKKSFNEKEVLKGAGYTFEKGHIYGLLGKNGAGKTTLFNCISGELPCDGGMAVINDGSKERQLQPEQVGFAYSTPVLPDFLTGYEFIRFYQDIHQKDRAQEHSAEEYARLVCLDPNDLNRLIKGYSHGMKNKIQMLALLISHPEVILLDEPLTSLDLVAAHEMKELLLEMKKDHIIILSTHILQLARDLCDEIVLLHQGVLAGIAQEQYHREDFEENLMKILASE